MNNDRVNELYNGAISSAEGQRICRDRIHWMVAQIHGQRVLDIGCSQGITSILAAREGRDVVGVEVEEPAIEFARRALSAEPAEVRARVKLVLADILADDLGGARFDTVILGEILEHLDDPRALLERAVEFLAPGGAVVISTPFGYHPHDDHKVTFYLSELARMIDGLCTPTGLEIADGYIRFVGRHRDAAVATPLDLGPAALLARSEAGFLAKEQTVHGRMADRKRKIQRLTAEQTRRTLQVEALDGQVKWLKGHLDRAQAKVQELVALRKELTRELRKQRKLTEKARKLPPILPPPPDAGRITRGLAMIFGSLQHEIHAGRAFRRPHTALIKTTTRTVKAFRRAPQLKAAPEPTPAPAPEKSTVEVAAPAFPPFTPLVAAPRSPLTIATILDTFSESCFRYEANLVPLSLKGWQAEMEAHRPAFLLAESAWLGNGGQWQYLFSKYLARDVNPLRDLLAWCKAEGVTRVFWNKEDPSNFEVFKDVAQDFDIVFTTDEDCIPRYRELLGHDRIYPLPFAAQPAIHNPMHDAIKRNRSVCFAGSWRARKYPERATDTETLLAPALEFGLDIFDRNANSKKAQELAFPAPFEAAVRGSLDYDAMLSAYRGYKAFLNVNSVKESPTMFARRVFELMACGTPVISSESVGIRAMLGSLVKIASTPEETRQHLERLLGDTGYRARYAHAGYREVLTRHTYGQRLRAITDAVGVSDATAPPPRVSILAATNRPDRLDHLLGSLRRQIHPDIEVILLLNSDGFDPAAVERATSDLPLVQIFSLPESHTLAECLNYGIDHTSGTWVAKFDDDDHYGAHYLSDLLLATSYTDAPILGKRSCFYYLESTNQLALRFPEHAHKHVEFVAGATLFVRRDVFDQVRFLPVERGTDTMFQRQCRDKEIPIYSADPFNFIVTRQASASAHTWQISDEQLLSRCRVVAPKLDMGLVMI
jgi:spore maturation protein CgeB/SAM-dependent methyltransferase